MSQLSVQCFWYLFRDLRRQLINNTSLFEEIVYSHFSSQTERKLGLEFEGGKVHSMQSPYQFYSLLDHIWDFPWNREEYIQTAYELDLL